LHITKSLQRFEKVIERFVHLFEASGIKLIVFFDGLRGKFKKQVSLDRRAQDAKTVAVGMQNISSPRKHVSKQIILPIFALVFSPHFLLID